MTADWLIAADGGDGKIGQHHLGIPRTGPGVLQHWMNIIFETDMSSELNGRRFTSCFVSEPRWHAWDYGTEC